MLETYGKDLHKQMTAYDNLGPKFFHALAKEIGKKMEACDDAVPVVTGTFSGAPF